MTADEVRALREKLAAGAVAADGGCLLWSRGKTSHGYGMVYVGRKWAATHRAAWIVEHGEIPAGMFVCHRCDVKHCISPSHLFLGTPLDNMRDMIAKGRSDYPAGQRHSHAKLTDADVLAIRASGLGSSEAAKRFGISEPSASQIIRRKAWKHLADEGRDWKLFAWGAATTFGGSAFVAGKFWPACFLFAIGACFLFWAGDGRRS